MQDDQGSTRREPDEPEEPTVAKPLHGERRGWVGPLLIVVGFFAALVLLYYLGIRYLIPAG